MTIADKLRTMHLSIMVYCELAVSLNFLVCLCSAGLTEPLPDRSLCSNSPPLYHHEVSRCFEDRYCDYHGHNWSEFHEIHILFTPWDTMKTSSLVVLLICHRTTTTYASTPVPSLSVFVSTTFYLAAAHFLCSHWKPVNSPRLCLPMVFPFGACTVVLFLLYCFCGLLRCST